VHVRASLDIKWLSLVKVFLHKIFLFRLLKKLLMFVLVSSSSDTDFSTPAKLFPTASVEQYHELQHWTTHG
jgi:hypothetical protein